MLRELGARPDDIKAITAALGARGRDGGVRENHKLRVLLAPTNDPKFVHPIRVVIANDSAIEAVVAWSDLGRYVQVDIRNLETEVAALRGSRRKKKTTAAACGSIRASTRPRCAIRCRAR